MTASRRQGGTISERSVVKRPMLSGSSLENSFITEGLQPLELVSDIGSLSQPCKPDTPVSAVFTLFPKLKNHSKIFTKTV